VVPFFGPPCSCVVADLPLRPLTLTMTLTVTLNPTFCSKLCRLPPEINDVGLQQMTSPVWRCQWVAVFRTPTLTADSYTVSWKMAELMWNGRPAMHGLSIPILTRRIYNDSWASYHLYANQLTSSVVRHYWSDAVNDAEVVRPGNCGACDVTVWSWMVGTGRYSVYVRRICRHPIPIQ